MFARVERARQRIAECVKPPARTQKRQRAATDVFSSQDPAMHIRSPQPHRPSDRHSGGSPYLP
jgi:hypothetical protein